jgi:hypothetical protein
MDPAACAARMAVHYFREGGGLGGTWRAGVGLLPVALAVRQSGRARRRLLQSQNDKNTHLRAPLLGRPGFRGFPVLVGT